MRAEMRQLFTGKESATGEVNRKAVRERVHPLRYLMDRILGLLLWQKICSVILILCLAASITLSLIRGHMEERLFDQRAYLTWSESGEGVSQLSVFWPIGSRADYNTIRALEYDITQELVKVSEADTTDDLPDFVTCMSAPGSVTISADNGKKRVEARAIGTAGDFFRFHPVKMLSGMPYADDLLTPDRILLDEDLAWQLFGSFDITGFTVNVGGVTHTVSGVFKLEDDGLIEKQAGIPGELCFLSLESLCQVGTLGDFTGLSGEQTASATAVSGSSKTEGTASSGSGGNTPRSAGSASAKTGSGSTGSSKISASGAGNAGGERASGAAVGTQKIYGVSTWEIIMPDPVKNFARNLVREKVHADREEAYVVENSARFLPEELAKNLKGPFTRGMQIRPLVYPWWENVARGYTNLFMILWLVQTVFAAAAVVITAVLTVHAFRCRTWTLRGIWQKLMDRKYELESRWRYERDGWKYF